MQIHSKEQQQQQNNCHSAVCLWSDSHSYPQKHFG